MYVPYSLENGSPSQNVLNSDLTKSQICPILGQLDPLWLQIWPPLFGKFQIEQQSDLDDAQEDIWSKKKVKQTTWVRSSSFSAAISSLIVSIWNGNYIRKIKSLKKIF